MAEDFSKMQKADCPDPLFNDFADEIQYIDCPDPRFRRKLNHNFSLMGKEITTSGLFLPELEVSNLNTGEVYGNPVKKYHRQSGLYRGDAHSISVIGEMAVEELNPLNIPSSTFTAVTLKNLPFPVAFVPNHITRGAATFGYIQGFANLGSTNQISGYYRGGESYISIMISDGTNLSRIQYKCLTNSTWFIFEVTYPIDLDLGV